MVSRVLIIGACGQIGSELTNTLRIQLGVDNVIASDIRESNEALVASGPFEIIDAKDFEDIKKNVLKYNVDTIYLMAAMLSATGEKYPEKAWDLNMSSLFNVLNLAKENTVKKVFWPSSIAVFGPSTPKINTPQQTVMEPTTVYGITKQVGERWCEYYFNNYGVDVRSIRYPGIISWKTLPGGGTTDYAIDIFHKAISDGHYDCFLTKSTALPMMFMEDAVKATLDIMKANTNDVKIRSSYNLSAISFTPQELADEIAKQIPEFTISYTPDFRQKIADSWPNSIDDSSARQDWNWNHSYDLEAITNEMLLQLKEKAIS
ncbi:NAD-dependent epimerase/dehydratase family protein [Flavobacteriaceae bacterium S0825]|uniref:NAD-dependent epimerase/dehydratase family protein n=1 Tax=Gaetbulibacter sp. S0825 TaxID=2720084 RepID=UPI0014309330|nr:NAD-dependent epimerase/dehydratase family protein [Gaetbulibacter sp. S0825]MCK0107711.1 NAD-dependent epimerase/dehydratase family protein [Flavobacteriaceae bacterium S0825]NIX63347.1 NAD-dependent epimerase/dehydratase family protein [Gaetbulibacter sp. S0825]